jgi:hypothetical protein
MTERDETSGQRRARGPERAGALLASRIREAGESRGFAVSRLLTHWVEIAGADIARVTQPVEVSYGKGFGATLTLLAAGAHAPMIEMQKERLREKVNACYGYSAISRIRITQTARSGFAEPQADFAQKTLDPSPEVVDAAHRTVDGVADDTLRAALEALGRNVLSSHRTT